MSIQTVVDQVLALQVLTTSQERHLDALLQQGVCTEADLLALENLINALSSRQVVAGPDRFSVEWMVGSPT
ncbi:MAG: hypothetical protein NW237_05440 [Cyanobacteriota bacterium]|nr:hypothetical protein [Cyanobacteriota bacterium]